MCGHLLPPFCHRKCVSACDVTPIVFAARDQWAHSAFVKTNTRRCCFLFVFSCHHPPSQPTSPARSGSHRGLCAKCEAATAAWCCPGGTRHHGCMSTLGLSGCCALVLFLHSLGVKLCTTTRTHTHAHTHGIVVMNTMHKGRRQTRHGCTVPTSNALVGCSKRLGSRAACTRLRGVGTFLCSSFARFFSFSARYLHPRHHQPP